MKSTTRWQKRVLLVLIVMALVSSLWAVWRSGDWEGLALNFGVEMAGAVVTYGLLELVVSSKERSEAKRSNLIAQLGTKVNAVAIAAAEELRRYGWLYDGSLQRANLMFANLQGASLQEANLQEASLMGVNLQEADLQEADLQGTSLARANLQEALLVRANLQKADLQETTFVEANLQEAFLMSANLQGAILQGATLIGADLQETILRRAILVEANLQEANLARADLQGAFLTGADLRGTTLPDGSKWSPDTDMARFTGRPVHSPDQDTTQPS